MPIPKTLEMKIAAALQQAESEAEQMDISYSLGSGKAYINPRVTAAIDSLSSDPVTHLRLVPLQEEGLIIGQAVDQGQAGVYKFLRTKGNRSGTVPLTAPLRHFASSLPKAGSLIFPVSVETVTVEERQIKVLLIHVSRHQQGPGRKSATPEG